jgi:hypothetical protein
MFYNGGDGDNEICGICKMHSTNGDTMADECQSIHEVKTVSQNNTRPGKLNTGEVLKQLVPEIGKLTFCQPHAHAIDENNGVNFYKDTSGKLSVSCHTGYSWKIKDKTEDSKGMIPTKTLYENPEYNLVLNTPTMIDSYGEFLSTINYSTGTCTI